MRSARAGSAPTWAAPARGSRPRRASRRSSGPRRSWTAGRPAASSATSSRFPGEPARPTVHYRTAARTPSAAEPDERRSPARKTSLPAEAEGTADSTVAARGNPRTAVPLRLLALALLFLLAAGCGGTTAKPHRIVVGAVEDAAKSGD